jgi:pyruvate dehydrogenase E1 component alpha subunit
MFHESLNLASVRKAPFVLIVENNQYAYSTPVHQQMNIQDIADRAASYGIPSLIVDGNDVEAVYDAVRGAVAHARTGGGPTLIEAKTMRMMGHAVHDAAEYVSRTLLAEWDARDPVRTYAARLLEQSVADEARLREIRERCKQEIADAAEYAELSPWPDPATVEEGVYAP